MRVPRFLYATVLFSTMAAPSISKARWWLSYLSGVVVLWAACHASAQTVLTDEQITRQAIVGLDSGGGVYSPSLTLSVPSAWSPSSFGETSVSIASDVHQIRQFTQYTFYTTLILCGVLVVGLPLLRFYL
jgi:ABC-type bacteriocin/lantibiotic exporter with double-glycine peptidase domain